MGTGLHGRFGGTKGAQLYEKKGKINFTRVRYMGTVKVKGVKRDVSRNVYQRDDINFNLVIKDS